MANFEIPQELLDDLTGTMRQVFAAWLAEFEQAQAELAQEQQAAIDATPTRELLKEMTRLEWDLMDEDYENELRAALVGLGADPERVDQFMDERFKRHWDKVEFAIDIRQALGITGLY